MYSMWSYIVMLLIFGVQLPVRYLMNKLLLNINNRNQSVWKSTVFYSVLQMGSNALFSVNDFCDTMFRTWRSMKVSRKDAQCLCDSLSMWHWACVSQVLSDPSAPPAALAAEQWLHRSVSPRDVCRGWEVHQLPLSSQSITQSCQSLETPLHRLLWHRHPAERVSEDTYRIFSPPLTLHRPPPPSIFVFLCLILSFHLSYAPSQSPPVSARGEGWKTTLLVNRF